MTFVSGAWLRQRHLRSAPLAVLAFAALLAASSWAPTPRSALAADLTPDEKMKFLESICSRMDNHERCMNAGKLVLERSLAWLIFEACSASGSRELVVACFDRMHVIAFEQTGDPRFDKTHRHCNRFEGEQVGEAKLLCYRADFKYANYYNALRERMEKSENGAAALKQ